MGKHNIEKVKKGEAKVLLLKNRYNCKMVNLLQGLESKNAKWVVRLLLDLTCNSRKLLIHEHTYTDTQMYTKNFKC